MTTKPNIMSEVQLFPASLTMIKRKNRNVYVLALTVFAIVVHAVLFAAIICLYKKLIDQELQIIKLKEQYMEFEEWRNSDYEYDELEEPFYILDESGEKYDTKLIHFHPQMINSTKIGESYPNQRGNEPVVQILEKTERADSKIKRPVSKQLPSSSEEEERALQKNIMSVPLQSRINKRMKRSARLGSHRSAQTQDLTSTEDERHNIRSYLHSKQEAVETLEPSEDQLTIIRPIRKHALAAHYEGDSSKYIKGRDRNFNGNGHMRHLDKTYVDWKPRQWVNDLEMDNHFKMEQGIVTVEEPGIYLVYAQIYYLDKHDLNGFMVYKNDHAILQCTTMTHSTEPVLKSNTCYTAGVEHLQIGDRISVRDLSDGRYSLFQKEKSFFGVVKLGDSKMKK